MRLIILVLFAAMFISPVIMAQKSGSGYKIQQPQRKTKTTKVGFAGKNPGLKHVASGQGRKRNTQASAGYSGKSLKKKSVKLGIIGGDPSKKIKKARYMKSGSGSPNKGRLNKKESKLFKPARNVDFIAADKSQQNKNLKIPKAVTDKDMILPKIRGDKKAVQLTKLEMRGLDPGINVNAKNEKKMNDIQYRSAYKFDRKGKANKEYFRKNKDR
ncbi:MAG TPA: hypothetical protein VI583_10000 [Cyclobacteriaceae bacterium]|nr:hypothetical protein [Cyclobacteriaceae bacterium]